MYILIVVSGRVICIIHLISLEEAPRRTSFSIYFFFGGEI